MSQVLASLRRSGARVRAGFVLFFLGKAALIAGPSLGGALPAVAAAAGAVMEVVALVMVWSGLEGFIAGSIAGFEETRGERPPLDR